MSAALPFKTKVALWFLGVVAVTLAAIVVQALLRSFLYIPALLLQLTLLAGLVGGWAGLLRRTDWGWWCAVLVLGILAALGALASLEALLHVRELFRGSLSLGLLVLGQSVALLVLCGTPFVLLIVDRKAYALAVRTRRRRP